MGAYPKSEGLLTMNTHKIFTIATCGISLGAVAGVVLSATTPTVVQAQSVTWAVWENCVNGKPCTIGVAPKSYAPRNSPNWLAGWRQKSQFYNESETAWRTACFWHYGGDRNAFSPDIAGNRFNCGTVCSNGTCQ